MKGFYGSFFASVAGSVALIAVGSANAAERVLSPDEMYFTVGAPRFELVSEEISLDPSESAPRSTLPPEEGLGSEIDQMGVLFDKILNFGKKVWAVVDDNHPVVNVSTDVASALPEGVKDWQSLQGWSAPISRVYRVRYENLYGITVIDFSYRVLATYGGNLKGKGRYLTHLTVIPADLSVMWGYTFNVTATIPSVTNVGTTASPIAGAQMLLSWKTDTALSHVEGTRSFYVQGDGYFLDLSNGT